MKYSIAADIGGTKIAVAIVDETGQMKEKLQVPSLVDTKDRLFDCFIEAIEKLLVQANLTIEQVEGIGVGLPGKVNREEGIAVFQNNIPWENFPIKERILEHYPDINAIIDNDVAMATYGEWFTSELEEKGSLTYMTISTGIASGAIFDKQLFVGNGFSGEIGLIRVPTKFEDHVVRLEHCAAGPALLKYGQKFIDPSITHPKEIFEAYHNGNEEAKFVVHSVAESLAIATENLISILDPEIIVLGGSVAEHNPFLIDLIKEEIEDLLLDAQKDAIDRIRVSKNNNQQGMIGAATRLF